MKLFNWLAKKTDDRIEVQLSTKIKILTPKDKFNILISETIKPLLKTYGFRKKGLTFYKQADELIFVINFQNSQGNTFEKTIFYINCGIYSSLIDKTIDKIQLNEPKEYECHYKKRISQITKVQKDEFEIDDNSVLEELIAKVEEDVLIVLTHFDRIVTTSDLTNLMINENEFGNNLFDYFISINDKDNIVKYITMMAKIWSNEKRWNSIKNQLNEQLKENNFPTSVEMILAEK